jgi:succinate-semialdehyde dehydrogenase/glutarate-semialdehyde dehydrogenase
MTLTDRPNTSSTSAYNGHSGHRTIKVMNPVTGAKIGEVPIRTPDEVREAVRRARIAQRIWGAQRVQDRCAIVMRFAELLWQNQREAMDTIRAETGKTDTGAFLEVLLIDHTATWLKHNAESQLRPESRMAMFPLIQRAKVYHKPHGVVGFITPWNYPLLLTYIDVLPALVAGNAAVIKPSEITPFSTLYGADLMVQAGVPRDLIQVVTGDAETGKALVDQVDYISFTGSTEVGRMVAQQAAGRLIGASLELGGKDAAIVLRDADLDLAATNILITGLENAGQTCISLERVYVEAQVYHPFIEKIEQYIQNFTLGRERGFAVNMGSMTIEVQLEKVEAQVADALAKGAKLIYGGKRRPDLGPLFYEPAVLIDVDHTMQVMNEETFGPVIPIMRVVHEGEAITLANSTRFGLSAAIYTRDLALGEHLATQLDTGDVSVNRAGMVPFGGALPWGGQRDSGLARRGGREGLMRFVTPQVVLVDRMWGAEVVIEGLSARVLSAILLMRRLRKRLPFV